MRLKKLVWENQDDQYYRAECIFGRFEIRRSNPVAQAAFGFLKNFFVELDVDHFDEWETIKQFDDANSLEEAKQTVEAWYHNQVMQAFEVEQPVG